MRKESSTLQKCKRQMATLGFDSQLAYHRVKLILKIYRDVVWVLSERVEELHEYAWELGDQDADTGLTRQKVLSTSERITTLTAELNDGNSKIEEMKAEFNRIVSWSKIFDESPMEVKKMICGYIIKKVSVFRDYRVKIEFNINVEQFLNGIDSIDECATYELPMAQ